MSFYKKPKYVPRSDIGRRVSKPQLIKMWLSKANKTMKDFNYDFVRAERYAAKVRNAYVYNKSKKRLDRDVAGIIYGYLDPFEI